jgi:hypothetical protein
MELVVRDQDVDPAALDAELRADRYPPATPIPVAEISDGRFWVFADAAAVRAWQQTRPNTSVTVAIIPLGDETETPA